jgi:opacity protein-like surface antigen
MKPFKLSAPLFIILSLLSSVAFAHLSLKDEGPPTSTSVFCNWTGYYGGLNLGALNHTLNMTDNQAVAFFATITQASNHELSGGLQVGYRKQLELTPFSGIGGIEFSTNITNASFNKEYGSPTALYQLNSKHELKYLSLLQLTGGIVANRTLLFLAAGLSWINLTGSTTNLDGDPFFNSFSVNKNMFGSAVSAGFEYSINEKISARFKIDMITPNTFSTTNNTGDKFQISNNIVQGAIGINYKFA